MSTNILKKQRRKKRPPPLFLALLPVPPKCHALRPPLHRLLSPLLSLPALLPQKTSSAVTNDQLTKFLGLVVYFRVCGSGTSVTGSPRGDLGCLRTHQKAGLGIAWRERAFPASRRNELEHFPTGHLCWSPESLGPSCCHPSLLGQRKKGASESWTSRHLMRGNAKGRLGQHLCFAGLWSPARSHSCPALLPSLQDSVQRPYFFLKKVYKPKC